MREREVKSTRPSSATPAPYAYGGLANRGGERAAGRATRAAAASGNFGRERELASAPGQASVSFGDVRVHPEERSSVASRPRLRVREFGVGAPGALTLGARPDKSLREESELQDQSANVATFGATASGVHMEVEAEGVYTSTEFPNGFKWTQTIDTNHPLGGTTSPYVDPRPNDDAKPFYWTDAEQTTYPTRFIDFPNRPTPASGTTTWDATLCLNGVDETTKSVTAFDCLSYGFSVDSAGAVAQHGLVSSSGSAHRSTLKSEFPDWTFK